MAPRDPGEPVPLMSEERNGNVGHNYDMEANATRNDPKNQNLEHEYSIPAAIKFTWLGTYFMFSLMLTIYNKLVLGVVSSTAFEEMRCQRQTVL